MIFNVSESKVKVHACFAKLFKVIYRVISVKK